MVRLIKSTGAETVIDKDAILEAIAEYQREKVIRRR